MTTTLAPPNAVHPHPPGSSLPANGAPATPQVTGVLVVRAEALASTRRLVDGRITEVLDALAAQTRPLDRLVVVAVEGLVTGLPGQSPSVVDRVRQRVQGHAALRAAVPDCVVVGDPGPLDVDGAVRLAAIELDRQEPAAETPPAETPRTEPDESPAGPVQGGTPAGRPDPPAGGASAPAWFWLLDDTCAPTPTALLRLIEAVRRSRSVGVAGPKVVQWDNPRLLVELGRQVTRAGRRIDAPAYGEADQGQYDTRTDVLAVGVRGMLLSRQTYDSLGGFEPAFVSTSVRGGADLDLGWRAQLSGQRVIVVPGAVLRRARSAEEVQAGPLATRGEERRAARRVALTRCAPLAVPFLVVWILVSSIGSALGLLLLKRPQHAWAELGDIAALLRPIRSTAARWRFRGRKTVRRRDVQGLFVGSGAAVGHTWDRVQEALTPERTARTGAVPGTTENAEPGPVSEEAEALTGLPPSLPQRIAGHPGFLAVLACAVLSAVTFRSALTGGVLDAQGAGLSGGELHTVATNADGLWHLYRDAWHGAGFGNTLDVSPAMGVLAALTWLVQAVPYVAEGRSPAGVTLSWLVLAAMPLAAWSAYLAARVATRARWGRGLVALAWGTSGVLTAALSQGRVSLVVAHIMLPMVVAGFGAAMKRQGTWTATFATALAAGILGAFVPVLLAVLVVAAVVAVAAAPGVSRRLRALVLAVVPVALLGPWLLRFPEEPPLLLTGPGLLDAGTADPTSPWLIALAQPDGGRRLLGLLFVPLLAAAVVALARRSGGRPRGTALTALTVAAVVGLTLALLSERVEVGQAIGADGRPTLATLWTGVGLDLYVAAVLAVVLVGWHGLSHALGERRFGWRRLVAGTAAALLAAAVAAGGALAAWPGSPALALGVDALPAVAVDQAGGPDANRLVVLTPAADRIDYALIGNEPGSLMRDVERRVDVTDPGLAVVLASIASGNAPPSGAGEALADLGVGFVSLRAAGDEPLTRTLDASQGLTRLGADADQTLWRVVARPSAIAADVAVPPSRVRLDDSQGHALQALPVDGPHGAVSLDLSVGASGRTVVFAEAPEWAQHAVVSFGGQVLSPVTTGSSDSSGTSMGTPTYALPATAGRLEADLPPAHPRWFLAQLALLAVVVFLAVPFGTRRSRRMS